MHNLDGLLRPGDFTPNFEHRELVELHKLGFASLKELKLLSFAGLGFVAVALHKVKAVAQQFTHLLVGAAEFQTVGAVESDVGLKVLKAPFLKHCHHPQLLVDELYFQVALLFYRADLALADAGVQEPQLAVYSFLRAVDEGEPGHHCGRAVQVLVHLQDIEQILVELVGVCVEGGSPDLDLD